MVMGLKIGERRGLDMKMKVRGKNIDFMRGTGVYAALYIERANRDD